MVPLTYKKSAEIADDEYPLILTTDRSLYHYHSATMTRRVDGLEQLDSNEWLKLSPADAAQYGIEDGEWVEVYSRRGVIKVHAQVTDICPPGVCSMTFHFHESPTNEITNPALDPGREDSGDQGDGGAGGEDRLAGESYGFALQRRLPRFSGQPPSRRAITRQRDARRGTRRSNARDRRARPDS